MYITAHQTGLRAAGGVRKAAQCACFNGMNYEHQTVIVEHKSDVCYDYTLKRHITY